MRAIFTGGSCAFLERHRGDRERPVSGNMWQGPLLPWSWGLLGLDLLPWHPEPRTPHLSGASPSNSCSPGKTPPLEKPSLLLPAPVGWGDPLWPGCMFAACLWGEPALLPSDPCSPDGSSPPPSAGKASCVVIEGGAQAGNSCRLPRAPSTASRLRLSTGLPPGPLSRQPRTDGEQTVARGRKPSPRRRGRTCGRLGRCRQAPLSSGPGSGPDHPPALG